MVKLIDSMAVKNATTNSTIIRALAYFEQEDASKADAGKECFLMLSATTLWMMIPGCGFFYSGLAHNKSVVSLITLTMWSLAVVSLQWYLFGYSLTFSLSSGNPFIGNFAKALLVGVKVREFPRAVGISELSFSFYQGISACLPTSLIVGALTERAKVLPFLLFVFLWNTLVYNPCGYWSLNPNGWSSKLGVLDFGGASPIHLPGSAAALSYSLMLGPRANMNCFHRTQPQNMLNIMIGVIFIWFGSFGYNAGSEDFTENGGILQGVMACWCTHLSASAAAMTWSILDYIQGKKWSAVGFCTGAIVGILVITPGSGYIAPYHSILFGIVGSVVCRKFYHINIPWCDDALHVFRIHGVAGVLGNILTGIFAQKAYGGKEVGLGGWLDGHWIQVPIQLADTLAGFLWSFVISTAILYIMNKIPGLRLRTSSENLDYDEFGVDCYGYLDERAVFMSNYNKCNKPNVLMPYSLTSVDSLSKKSNYYR